MSMSFMALAIIAAIVVVGAGVLAVALWFILKNRNG